MPSGVKGVGARALIFVAVEHVVAVELVGQPAPDPAQIGEIAQARVWRRAVCGDIVVAVDAIARRRAARPGPQPVGQRDARRRLRRACDSRDRRRPRACRHRARDSRPTAPQLPCVRAFAHRRGVRPSRSCPTALRRATSPGPSAPRRSKARPADAEIALLVECGRRAVEAAHGACFGVDVVRRSRQLQSADRPGMPPASSPSTMAPCSGWRQRPATATRSRRGGASVRFASMPCDRRQRLLAHRHDDGAAMAVAAVIGAAQARRRRAVVALHAGELDIAAARRRSGRADGRRSRAAPRGTMRTAKPPRRAAS